MRTNQDAEVVTNPRDWNCSTTTDKWHYVGGHIYTIKQCGFISERALVSTTQFVLQNSPILDTQGKVVWNWMLAEIGYIAELVCLVFIHDSLLGM